MTTPNLFFPTAGRVGKGRYSPEQDERGTPPEFVAGIASLLGIAFDLDVAATEANAKARFWYTREDDGLARSWYDRAWCNPPFGPQGRYIARWLAKARTEVQGPACELAAVLVPAKTDTTWWHEHVMRAGEVLLVRGRLTFLGPDGKPMPAGAGFGVAVAVFRGGQRPDVATRFRSIDKNGRAI